MRQRERPQAQETQSRDPQGHGQQGETPQRRRGRPRRQAQAQEEQPPRRQAWWRGVPRAAALGGLAASAGASFHLLTHPQNARNVYSRVMYNLNAPFNQARDRFVHQQQADHMDQWNRRNLGEHYHHPLYRNGRFVGTYGQALREMSEDAWPFAPNNLRGQQMPEQRRHRREALLEADRRREIPVTFRPRITPSDPAHKEQKESPRKELKRRGMVAPSPSPTMDSKLTKRADEPGDTARPPRSRSASEASSEAARSDSYHKRKPLQSVRPTQSGAWKKWMALGVGALAVTGGSRAPIAAHRNAVRVGSHPVHGLEMPVHPQPPLVREQVAQVHAKAERDAQTERQRSDFLARLRHRQEHIAMRQIHVRRKDAIARAGLGDRYHQPFYDARGEPTGQTWGQRMRQHALDTYPPYPYAVKPPRARTPKGKAKLDEQSRERGEKTMDEKFNENQYAGLKKTVEKHRESIRPKNRSRIRY